MSKIILILSLSNLDEAQVLYYENLVNEIKQTYANKIDVLLTLNSMQIFNGNFSYEKYENEIYEFGCTCSNILLEKFKSIYRDKTIIVPNKGWDIGPFLIGLNFVKNQYDYVFCIHSKSNETWRNDLLDIKNINVFEKKCDTLITEFKFVYTEYNDKNLDILKDNERLFPHKNLKKWKYNSGKIFVSKCEFFDILLNNFAEIYNLLTDINKNDTFWCDYMDDKRYYDLEFKRLSNCPWNLPMTQYAHEMRKKYNARNYFELLKYGYRGIPDLQIEHAIERYMGYLICYNKDIYIV
jgi:hypothetical protein